MAWRSAVTGYPIPGSTPAKPGLYWEHTVDGVYSAVRQTLRFCLRGGDTQLYVSVRVKSGCFDGTWYYDAAHTKVGGQYKAVKMAD